MYYVLHEIHYLCTMFETIKFATAVKKFRLSRLLTLRDATKQCGVSPATISRVENRGKVDMDTFTALCTWMNHRPSRYFSSSRA